MSFRPLCVVEFSVIVSAPETLVKVQIIVAGNAARAEVGLSHHTRFELEPLYVMRVAEAPPLLRLTYPDEITTNLTPAGIAEMFIALDDAPLTVVEYVSTAYGNVVKSIFYVSPLKYGIIKSNGGV